ncbi:RNA-binding protein 40-like isoform X2 [Varroa destructor]|uniref:RRM domain-containing protein n=1 Tax=Varroa destructor TaxID=109461 RepID=A0A7M7K5M3_VARDE|nr:RNA-binding protein 40-like isoform X2 [Varroa destructor]
MPVIVSFYLRWNLMPSRPYLVNRSVLQVRHLPPAFAETECVSFLKAHGALSVSVPGRGRAFAFYRNEVEARRAMGLLHQLQLKDCLLLVTFARSNHNIPLLPPVVANPEFISENEQIIQRLHAIAPRLGFNYVLNPMVKYKYPPLTDTILANICVTLRNHADFYTQVLHLMNKMNLQAPFRRQINPSQVFREVKLKDVSTAITSESGSEVSDEEHREVRPKPLLSADETCIPNKRLRVPKRHISTIELLPKEKPREVSECFDSTNPIRKLELPSISQISAQTTKEYSCPAFETGFGQFKPSTPPERSPEPPSRFNWSSAFTVITAMEKISLQDAIDHPAFRNYEECDPCVRLYIKNIPKSVTEEDLFLLFGQFVPDNEAERAIFDIRLMKTGRMRGQAFVTFGSVGAAQKALKGVHRLVLKGKPLAVQFAKSNAQ